MEKINIVKPILVVGQTIWYKSLSGRRGDDISLKESKVLSVGKKYFEIEGLYRQRFFIDTLIHDGGNYSPSYMAYISKEQYLNELEARKIHSELLRIFSDYSMKIEVEKLRAILEILRS